MCYFLFHSGRRISPNEDPPRALFSQSTTLWLMSKGEKGGGGRRWKLSLGEGGKGGEKKEEEGEGIGGVGEGGKRRGRGRPAFWQGFLPPTSLPSFQPSEVKEVSLSFHRLRDPPSCRQGEKDSPIIEELASVVCTVSGGERKAKEVWAKLFSPTVNLMPPFSLSFPSLLPARAGQEEEEEEERRLKLLPSKTADLIMAQISGGGQEREKTRPAHAAGQ